MKRLPIIGKPFFMGDMVYRKTLRKKCFEPVPILRYETFIVQAPDYRISQTLSPAFVLGRSKIELTQRFTFLN